MFTSSNTGVSSLSSTASASVTYRSSDFNSSSWIPLGSSATVCKMSDTGGSSPTYLRCTRQLCTRLYPLSSGGPSSEAATGGKLSHRRVGALLPFYEAKVSQMHSASVSVISQVQPPRAVSPMCGRSPLAGAKKGTAPVVGNTVEGSATQKVPHRGLRPTLVLNKLVYHLYICKLFVAKFRHWTDKNRHIQMVSERSRLFMSFSRKLKLFWVETLESYMW